VAAMTAGLSRAALASSLAAFRLSGWM